MTSAGSMHEAGHSKSVLWDYPEEWGGEGDGRGFRIGRNTSTHGLFILIYGKNHHSTIK